MKEIRCEFINPSDDLDYKRINNISIENSDAVKIDKNKRYYCSRNEIIKLIRQTYIRRELINGKKTITDKGLEYAFYIEIEENIKGKLIVSIPNSILLTDLDAKAKKRVMDCYEGKAIVIRKKRSLALLALAGVTIVGTLGLCNALVTGIEKTFDAMYEKNKKYHEEYERIKNFEENLKEYEKKQKEEENKIYGVSQEEYEIPEGYTTYNKSK